MLNPSPTSRRPPNAREMTRPRVVHAVDQAPETVTRARDLATSEGAGVDDTLEQVWVVIIVAHKYRRLIG